MNAIVPVTLLTGYLGSGKTTLINRLLADPQGRKIAVIVNDIGEINIDSTLIAAKGNVSVAEDSLVALTNGCICCTLRMDLVTQLVRLIQSRRFDYILIEASGLCEPQPIAQSVTMLDGSLKEQGIPAVCRLDAIVAVVDAYRLFTEFAGGQALLNARERDADIPKLLVEQIEFCNLVLLNKTDLLTQDEMVSVEAIVRALQPKARMVRTCFAQVPSECVFNTRLFDFSDTFLSAGWAQAIEHEDAAPEECGGERNCGCAPGKAHQHNHLEEYGVSTFIYYRRKPFDEERLTEWVRRFPASIIRCKGLVWLDTDAKMSYLFQQAGQSATLEPFGNWLAGATPSERAAAWARDPQSRDNWDDAFGDRMTKLAVIGVDMDQQAICEELDTCLAD